MTADTRHANHRAMFGSLICGVLVKTCEWDAIAHRSADNLWLPRVAEQIASTCPRPLNTPAVGAGNIGNVHFVGRVKARKKGTSGP